MWFSKANSYVTASLVFVKKDLLHRYEDRLDGPDCTVPGAYFTENGLS